MLSIENFRVLPVEVHAKRLGNYAFRALIVAKSWLPFVVTVNLSCRIYRSAHMIGYVHRCILTNDSFKYRSSKDRSMLYHAHHKKIRVGSNFTTKGEK